MADEYFAQQDRERERVSKPRQTRVAPAEQQPKENRDPNNLNSHIECQYYSVFAEPQTSPQSIDCIWEFSEIVFDCFKECWYKMFGLCCGICIAIAWGIEFVPVIFSHVWCFTPFIQLLNIILTGWCRPVWFLCVNLCISPCTQSCAYFFHNCGYGKMTRPPTPKIFPDRPKRKAAPKPIENKIEPKKEEKVLAPVPVVVAAKGEFDEYDKEKIAKSVKRQMMLF